MCLGAHPNETPISACSQTVLPDRLLGHISSWVKPKSLHSVRHTSRGHYRGLTPPAVPSSLLHQLRSHLPIQREAAFFRLERLAKQGSSDAIRAIVSCLRDDNQQQEIRKWALDLIGALADPGEAWAVNAIVKDGGPLMGRNDCVAQKALDVLQGVVDEGNAAALLAMARMVGDGRFSCRASITFAQIAMRADHVGSIATETVLKHLKAPSAWVQANAVSALGCVASRSDDTIVRELEAKALHANAEVRDRAVRALAQINLRS